MPIDTVLLPVELMWLILIYNVVSSAFDSCDNDGQYMHTYLKYKIVIAIATHLIAQYIMKK
jgi:hypothetical protein